MIAQGNPSDYAFAQSLGRRRARHWAWALPIHGGRYGLYVAEGQGTGHRQHRPYIHIYAGTYRSYGDYSGLRDVIPIMGNQLENMSMKRNWAYIGAYGDHCFLGRSGGA